MTTEAGIDLKLAGATATGDFEPEQKRYLEGFAAGLQIAKTAKGLSGSLAGSAAGLAGALAAPAPEPVGPDAAALKAQDRVLKAGGKLSDPEKFKREQHPFDTYERLKGHAAKNEYPKPPDNFRWRFFGLFYVAPNQNSFMCRLRMPNGILSRPRNLPASPIWPSAMAAATPTSPPAPICRSARSRPRTRST